MDSRRLVQVASAIVVGAIFCIIFNQSRKRVKKVAQTQSKQVSQDFMVETFKPIEDFEMIYFDETKGLVQINLRGDGQKN
jgi:ABC-type bacteriocin/lantibiotic exporter with double-glycine peptidase domain